MIDFETAYATILESSSGGGSGDHSSVGRTMMDGKNSVIVDDVWKQSLSCSPHPPSRLLIIIKWIGKVLSATYLSQPWVLAIFPFFLGIILGTILVTTTTTKKRHYSTKYTSKNPFHPPSSSHQQQEEEDETVEYQTPTLQEQEKDQLIRNTLSLVPHNKQTNNNGSNKTGDCHHLAVIMDGNRRYGKQKYGNATQGHSDGSRRLIEFISWCMEEQIQELTVYAFSTENWNRSPQEVQALMDLLYHYMDELRTKAIERGIQINVLSTDTSKIPKHVVKKIQRIIDDTKNNTNFVLNICLSYGGRGELVQACQRLTQNVMDGVLDIDDINEKLLSQQLSTSTDPDIILRTSGEFRLSNFLLWQSAYSEFFFLSKPWPDITQEDLKSILTQYSQQRQRRYGK